LRLSLLRERRRSGRFDAVGLATARQPSRAERGGIVVVAVAGAVAAAVFPLAGPSLPHAASASVASRITIRTVARRTS
jgi:hypothetical protein